MSAEVLGTIPSRFAGVLRLDRDAFAGIDADHRALYQAAAVVVLAGVANGLSIAVNQGTGAAGVALATAGNLAAWGVFAGLVYVVGVGILPGEGTEIEATSAGVYRTIGYAQAPNLLAIVGVIGTLGQIIALAGLVWMFICAIVAASVSLRVETHRALLIAVIAAIPTLILLSIVGSILDQPVM